MRSISAYFLVATCIALVSPAVAHAALEITAPEGIDLTGIWTIDPERSDDPKEAMQSLREQARSRAGGRISGGMGGMGSTGGQRSGGTKDREAMRGRMEQIVSASTRVEIVQLPDTLELHLDDRSSSCTSTEKSQVSMPDGEIADQRCGWDRDEFVVEFEGADGFKRTDRYSLGDEGQTLIVNTSLRGGRMPDLKLKSVYRRPEST